MESLADSFGYRFPKRDQDLISPTGYVNLSMHNPRGKNKESELNSSDPLHLYLEGVVGPPSIVEGGVQALLNNKQVLFQASERATHEMLDIESMKVDYPQNPALLSAGSRIANTRRMIGLAHHLVFNCDNHFLRVPTEVLMKFNFPQKHARHTVDYLKLTTQENLSNVLKALSATHSPIRVAVELTEKLDQELK